MARSVRISADSTVDLSPELLARYAVTVCPLAVTMGDQTYNDNGVDVKPADLFDYTRRTGLLAKTAAQSTEYYADYFRSLVADGGEVIHFTISAGMSSSYTFACLAAEDVPGIHVVDSANLSTGIALLVIKAAEMADAGMAADELVRQIEILRPRVDASFVIDTLEFLHKGGRCSTVAMLGANVLKLKPCIQVKDGAMDVGKKYRGKVEGAFREYAKDALHDPDDIDLSRVFVTHTCGHDAPIAKEIAEEVMSILPFEEVLITDAGCTISAHCGPGTLGVLFIRKSDKK